MKISIIIPVYNTGQYLHACLDSILSQSFVDYEVLLIDDGSQDGGGAICDQYAQKDDRVKVFHKENGGVSSARNLGLDRAKGEWVFFVDSDDELLPDGLQTMVNCISDDVDIVMGGLVEVDENGRLSEVPENVELTLSKKMSIITLYWGYGSYYPYCGYMCMRLLRRSIIQELHLLFDTSIAIKEDTLFLTQYICRSKGITRQTTTPVYKYKRRSDSAMGRVESGFDSKYVDSFHALVKMKHEVESLFPYFSTPVFVAEQGIIGRYYYILGMMDASKVYDDSLKKELCSILDEEVYSFFLFKIRRKVRKLIRIARNKQ